MSVDATFLDGGGHGNRARVTGAPSLQVSHVHKPAVEISEKEAADVRLFSEYLVNAAGSRDLNVNGSVTPVEFKLRARPDSLVFAEQLRLEFHSSNMDISSNESRVFGPAGVLPNGIQLFAEQQGTLVSLFFDPVTRISDFWLYQNSLVNDVNAIASGVDLLMVVITLRSPVALFPGSLDNLTVRIRDDLTGIQLFQVLALGGQRSV